MFVIYYGDISIGENHEEEEDSVTFSAKVN